MGVLAKKLRYVGGDGTALYYMFIRANPFEILVGNIKYAGGGGS